VLPGLSSPFARGDRTVCALANVRFFGIHWKKEGAKRREDERTRGRGGEWEGQGESG